MTGIKTRHLMNENIISQIYFFVFEFNFYNCCTRITGYIFFGKGAD